MRTRAAGPGSARPVVDLAGGGGRTGRLWRKVVLPVGRVKHGERVLAFDRPTLERIAANFRARAFDNVPLVLATPENRHNEDPTRYAGRVREMAVTDRGLEVVAALAERLAEVTDRARPPAATNPQRRRYLFSLRR